jgi:ribokinase
MTESATQVHSEQARVLVVGSTHEDHFSYVQRHPAPDETVLSGGGEIRRREKGADQAIAARKPRPMRR